ncbi:hypothetical protein ACFLY9_00660 [Patescibacteria group bacterium]
MWDFLLNLVQVNESINYSLIISVIVSYFFFIWFVVCIWIFFDARKRYESTITPALFCVFILIFGIPALIFYIMIRPEHTLEEDYYMNLALSGEKALKPICFDGDKGFDISINMAVQPKTEKDGKHKMEMQVAWIPQKFQSQGKVQKKRGSKASGFGKKVASQWNGFIQNLNSSLQNLGTRTKSEKKQTKEELEKKQENESKKQTRKVEEKKKQEEKKKN